ncbi:hypothetical protein EVAR_26685_1 [Eumeta japonica]|uniref:Uncharacterized protein n=1 Tax=Eumeta variegata TaxID=151549 RepID=A0A4C1VMG4_EUMVA|nr:hypothetical protein EVAR_26685_1 [Eumeta japonica]
MGKFPPAPRCSTVFGVLNDFLRRDDSFEESPIGPSGGKDERSICRCKSKNPFRGVLTRGAMQGRSYRRICRINYTGPPGYGGPQRA